MDDLGIPAFQGRQPEFGFASIILLQFPGLSLGNSNLVKADDCIQQQSWPISSISRPSVCRVHSVPGTRGASSVMDRHRASACALTGIQRHWSRKKPSSGEATTRHTWQSVLCLRPETSCDISNWKKGKRTEHAVSIMVVKTDFYKGVCEEQRGFNFHGRMPLKKHGV